MALNRRSFLVAAGAGAGLAVGWAVWPRRPGVEWAAGKGESVLNAFLKIGSDGRVTVAVPQAEMGQGVWSGLAQLAADELGADWRTVSVEPAPLGPEYANHAAFDGQLGEMSGMMRSIAEWAADKVVEFFDFQITGGSTSVIGFEQPLREAGAAAREMLCRAAARRWDVDWQRLRHQGRLCRLPGAAAALRRDCRRCRSARDAPRAPTLREHARAARQAVAAAGYSVQDRWQRALRRRCPPARHGLCRDRPGADRRDAQKQSTRARCRRVPRWSRTRISSPSWPMAGWRPNGARRREDRLRRCPKIRRGRGWRRRSRRRSMVMAGGAR